MKPYPDCDYLGSDAAELAAFIASLRLITKLEADGHTRNCAVLQTHDTKGCCTCNKAEVPK